MHHVYILRSLRNNKTYIGFTSKSADKRLKEHNLGSNKWTSQNGPFKLIYYESFVCKEDALNKERFLKTGVGKKLIKLIKENF